MALPKRKKSKSNRNSRRNHPKIVAPKLTRCPQCGEARQPHHACPSCGIYKSRTVIEIEEE